METSASVNYKRIYGDLLKKKFPEKLAEFQHLLNQDTLGELDVVKMSKTLSSALETNIRNGKHKSYSPSTIQKILGYQQTNHLNNTELAQHFSISRNTVAKWRRLYGGTLCASELP